MFKMTTPDVNSNLSKKTAIIKSVINSEIDLNNETWTISVVSKGIHGFIIFERCTGDENFWYRADLRPKNAVKSIGIGTRAEITFEKVTQENFQNLKDFYRCVAVPDVTPKDAEKILERIQKDIEENEERYFLPGDGTSVAWGSEQTKFDNCISYCQKIIEEELNFEVGRKKSLIKVPPWIVGSANKQKGNHKRRCQLM